VHHAKHREMIAKLLAVRQVHDTGGAAQVLTTTAVRVEAGGSRRPASSAALGRFQVRDVPLDPDRAERCIELVLRAGATAVDATVAEVSASQAGNRLVTVYTADVQDLTRLVLPSTGRAGQR